MEATASDNSAVVAAQAGDEQAFVRITAPYGQPLHRHCYRILGSLHDADDALQETMLRARRGINRFQPRGSLSAWLFRIATNVCLRMLEQRARHPGAAVDAHLEPYPDTLLDDLPSPTAGPDEILEERERIGLAFVAAMQLLPPKQRVTVVLRDVLDWSAREVAEVLDDTVPAVNSALQRGRDRLKRERQERSLARVHAPADAAQEERVMSRFQEAWAAVDFDAIVALLADDALLTMPPEAQRFEGSTQIGRFFATAPLDGHLDRIRLVPSRANGQPALAAYADEQGNGVYEGGAPMEPRGRNRRQSLANRHRDRSRRTPCATSRSPSSGASTGGFGAVWAQAELHKVLAAMGGRVVEGEVAVGHAMDRFESLGRLDDPNLEERVHEVIRDCLRKPMPRAAMHGDRAGRSLGVRAQIGVINTSIGKYCGAPPSGGGPPMTSPSAGPSFSSMKRSKASRDSQMS